MRSSEACSDGGTGTWEVTGQLVGEAQRIHCQLDDCKGEERRGRRAVCEVSGFSKLLPISHSAV